MIFGRIVITGRYQPTASLSCKGEVVNPSVVCGCRPDSHRAIGAGCRHSDAPRIVSDIINRAVMTLQPLDFGYPCVKIRHIPNDGCACEVNGYKTQTVGAKYEVRDRFGMATEFDRRAFRLPPSKEMNITILDQLLANNWPLGLKATLLSISVEVCRNRNLFCLSSPRDGESHRH